MNNRILIFIDWYRPGYKAGGPVTSVANLVDHLANPEAEAAEACKPGMTANTHDPDKPPLPPCFYILTRNNDYMDPAPYEGIEADRWTDRGERIRVCYLSPGNLNRRRLRDLAREARCDTWYINGIYSRYFSILPLRLARRIRPQRVIVAPRGMLSPHAIRVKPIRKLLFLSIARNTGIYHGVIFHATNQEEAQAIKQVLGEAVPVKVAPNLPARIPRDPLPSCRKEAGSLALVSLARISPEKNTLKALEILSRVRTGTVTFTLVGETGPAGYWRSCQELIRKLPPNIQVHHMGPVPPDQIPEVMQQSHVLFLPTTGENHGHAILECLSHGLPAVISDQTPWDDLQDHEAGWALPLKREQDFVAAIEHCLEMDQHSYDAKSAKTRIYARGFTKNPENIRLNQLLFTHE